MAGLQRSSETFGRSGSSGMVWEDKHQSVPGKDQQAAAATGPANAAARLQRSGSSGGGRGGYRAGHVQPALDPPSPRVAACGFCSLFGKDKQQQAAPRGGGGGGAKQGKRR